MEFSSARVGTYVEVTGKQCCKSVIRVLGGRSDIECDHIERVLLVLQVKMQALCTLEVWASQIVDELKSSNKNIPDQFYCSVRSVLNL